MRLSTSTAILHHHFDYALTLTDIPAVIRTAGFDALDWSTWQFCLQGKTAESCGFCASCHPYHNLLEFSKENSGRKLCKRANFALGNGISRRKNQHPRPTYEAILPIF